MVRNKQYRVQRIKCTARCDFVFVLVCVFVFVLPLNTGIEQKRERAEGDNWSEDRGSSGGMDKVHSEGLHGLYW